MTTRSKVLALLTLAALSWGTTRLVLGFQKPAPAGHLKATLKRAADAPPRKAAAAGTLGAGVERTVSVSGVKATAQGRKLHVEGSAEVRESKPGAARYAWGVHLLAGDDRRKVVHETFFPEKVFVVGPTGKAAVAFDETLDLPPTLPAGRYGVRLACYPLEAGEDPKALADPKSPQRAGGAGGTAIVTVGR